MFKFLQATLLYLKFIYETLIQLIYDFAQIDQ